VVLVRSTAVLFWLEMQKRKRESRVCCQCSVNPPSLSRNQNDDALPSTRHTLLTIGAVEGIQLAITQITARLSCVRRTDGHGTISPRRPVHTRRWMNMYNMPPDYARRHLIPGWQPAFSKMRCDARQQELLLCNGCRWLQMMHTTRSPSVFFSLFLLDALCGMRTFPEQAAEQCQRNPPWRPVNDTMPTEGDELPRDGVGRG